MIKYVTGKYMQAKKSCGSSSCYSSRRRIGCGA